MLAVSLDTHQQAPYNGGGLLLHVPKPELSHLLVMCRLLFTNTMLTSGVRDLPRGGVQVQVPHVLRAVLLRRVLQGAQGHPVVCAAAGARAKEKEDEGRDGS